MLCRIQYALFFLITDRSDNLCRDAHDQVPCRHYLPLGDKGPGANKRACADQSSIQDPGSHSYEAIFLYGATMNDGPMSNRYPISDIQREPVGCHVEHRTILDIGSTADPDPVHVTPHNRVVPETGVIAGRDIADDDSCGGAMKTSLPSTGSFSKWGKVIVSL